MHYAITDLESTGGTKGTDKITEIAIYLFDGEKIIDEFHSLINPKRSIEPFVVKLTGITDAMVKDAPTFEEVADRVAEITKDAIFVAHNVSFDYPFLRREYSYLGKAFERNRLCTVNLSRKIIPGHKSYSLGKLTDDLGIGLNGRHRADGDALATVELFKLLLAKDTTGLISPKNGTANPALPIELLSSLPMQTGIYYFYDKAGDLLYIGRSKNIHDRIFAHLSDTESKKAIEMSVRVADIKVELTGSDLIAQIYQAYEIRKYQPYYNETPKQTTLKYGLYSQLTADGYYETRVLGIAKRAPLMSFSSETQAQKFLNKKINQYDLCNCLVGNSARSRSCLHHQLHLCKGAGVKEETKVIYNKKVEDMLASISYETPNALVLCKGKTDKETGVVHIEHGVFKGFGFIEKKQAKSPKDYLSCITSYYETPEVKKLLLSHLRKGKRLEVVKLEVG